MRVFNHLVAELFRLLRQPFPEAFREAAEHRKLEGILAPRVRCTPTWAICVSALLPISNSLACRSTGVPLHRTWRTFGPSIRMITRPWLWSEQEARPSSFLRTSSKGLVQNEILLRPGPLHGGATPILQRIGKRLRLALARDHRDDRTGWRTESVTPGAPCRRQSGPEWQCRQAARLSENSQAWSFLFSLS